MKMIDSNAELLKYISDDVQKYDGYHRFVNAGFLERTFVKKCEPEMLHPNPNDEFSMPEIGPNFGIIDQYCSKFLSPARQDDTEVIEPLIVEKMEQGGYMILNGHHRWAAALKAGEKTVPISIVNLTHEEDHRRMLERSSNVKRVIFDFDEVLCASEAHPKAEEIFESIVGTAESRFKERLRWGVPKLINELQSQGFDVWIYTSSFTSVGYLQAFFKAYQVEVDGIINGAGRKKSAETELAYKEMIAKKYRLIYNVDTKSVSRIRTADKDIEIIDIEAADDSWTDQVLQVIKETSGDE